MKRGIDGAVVGRNRLLLDASLQLLLPFDFEPPYSANLLESEGPWGSGWFQFCEGRVVICENDKT